MKFGTCPKQNVINLSKYSLNEKELNALSYGLNFCIPPTKVNKELTYLGFENFLKQTGGHKPIKVGGEVTFKANLVALAHNYANTKPEKNLMVNTSEMSAVIRDIKNNEKIVLAKPDKGSGIVVLDKTDYLGKMNLIIDDKSKFLKLGPVSDFDNLSKIEKDIIDLLKRLVSNKEISQQIFNEIKPMGSIRPRMYGLPKLHKSEVPLRPILSMTKSPQHKLARFLNVVLEPVLHHYSQFAVKDSFEVVERIRKIQPENTFLSSFDVKKLFTNVPLNEVIQICVDRLYELEKPSIKKNSFIKLMKIATSDVQFSFNSVIYSQIDGVAMGFPLGPTLANIFIGYLESKVVEDLSSQVLYVRYMDDCLVISQTEKKNEALFSKLNSLHEKISFTKEIEQDNQIPFLDILITRGEEKFLTNIYRKPSFTGQYLHYQSFCTKKRKVNLIKTLYHRAFMICSPELLHSETETIKKILIKNGYPLELISRVIKSHDENCRRPKLFGPDKFSAVLKLPYLGKISQLFEKKIQDLTQLTFNHIKPRVVFVSKPVLSLQLKDPIPYLDKSCIIYKFNCFCERSYIGQTSRHFKTRIREHLPKCVTNFMKEKTNNKTKAVINAAKRSSIAEHLINNTDCANNYLLSRFEVMSHCNNVVDLVRLEAISIFLKKPELCKQKEFDYKVSLFV